MTTLRPYQTRLLHEVRQAWAGGDRNVVMRLDTGGGKTVCLSTLVQEHPGASAVIAHRAELVLQLSMALARYGVRHKLIAAPAVARAIAQEHVAEFGRSFYDPGARCAVCSIDTLKGAQGLASWAAQVTLWITDEGHHVVEENKWHVGIKMFTHPDVKGLLPTATPERADRQGLGRPPYGSGIADVMVEGPPMRWLINEGYLTDYRIICPPSDLEVLKAVAASGDWSTKVLREAAKKSHIVGDVVREYQRYAAGKLGVTFSTDVETATEIAEAYRKVGVPAAVLTGKTESGLRRQILRQFKARQILQLVAVDIISEGFDLPAMEVESSARPTASLPVWMQQFGRVLRPMYAPGHDLDSRAGRLAAIAASSKPHALVLDHAGNTARPGLGLPDRPRVWSLADGERKSRKSDAVGMRVCVNCSQPSYRTEPCCPLCGADWPEPASRGSPEHVDGDLHELDAETLAQLRGEVTVVDLDARAYHEHLVALHTPAIAQQHLINKHVTQQHAQASLRAAMGDWGGVQKAAGMSDRKMHKTFYLEFGVDVLSAQALGAREAGELEQRVREKTNG